MAGMWQRKGRKNIYRWLTVFLILAMVIQIVPWAGVSGFAATDMPENSLKTEAAQSPDNFLTKEDLLSTGIDEQIVPIGTIQASEDENGLEEIIVRFKDNTSLKMMSQSLDLADVTGSVAGDQELQLVEVASGEDLAEALAELRKNPRVEYAEPNYRLGAQTVPNDSRWDEQWGLNEVEASAAWDQVGQGTPNQVIVAVLDTGITEGHEDLQDRIIPGFSTISKTNDQSYLNDDSVNGHGTHLSGIIAGKTNNGIGIAGACGTLPVNILPVKVLDRSGYGTMYDISQGIIQAADQVINQNQKLVINLSLGARLPDYPRTLGDAIKHAQDLGALVIAAAGNDGKAVSGFYPASLEGVISVGASGVDHSPAKFSNKYAKITAPGVNILSTLPENKYGTLTGTSQATAFVSASAAVLWSLHPEKNADEVVSGIEKGQKKFPNYNNVMNMPGALNALAQGIGPNNDIEFLHPSDSTYVSDTVELSVKADNPAEMSRVEFKLYSETNVEAAGEGVVLGEVLGQPASGIYTLSWDTTKVDNGQYRIEAVSYDFQGQRLDNDHIYLWVVNEQKSGLSIQVKKPDGAMAAKAYVQVYYPYYNEQEQETIYQMLWQDQADLHGRVIIPGNQATDGNDYLITAIGTEPNFSYYQMARAPQKVVLDDADTVEITIKGNKLDGEPLAGAVIILDLLEANLPNPINPDQPTYALDQEPAATLDGNGEAKLILTPGRYNFRLLSGEDAYYLVQHDLKIDHDTQIINFQPQAGEVAEINLDRNPEFYRAILCLKDTEDYFYGFEDMAEGDSMIVSPGDYQGSIKAIYREVNPEKEWHWNLETPEFQINAGEKKTLSYGDLIHGTLENREEGIDYHSLNPLYLDPSFLDDHGNLTIGLGEQTGYTIEAASGNSAMRDIIRISTRQEENGIDLPQNPQKMSEPKVYLYNSTTNSFEIKASAIKNVYPTLEIRDSGGELVRPGYNWEQYSSYGYASWYIPETQAGGEYTAQAKLQAGPLGENNLVATNEVSFTVREYIEGEEPGFTLKVLDRLGQPLVDARVSLLRRVGDAYYPHWSEGERETDWKGQVQYDLELLSQEELIFVIYGRSPDPTTEIGVDPETDAPEYLEEPVFLIQALEEEDLALANKTIDTSQIPLNRVVLKALDGTGEITNYGNVLYSAYQKLEGKNYAGMTLTNPYSDEGLVLWVSDGAYIFQADVGIGGLMPVSLSEEDEGDDGNPPFYHIQKKIDITGPLGNDGLIELGRDLLAELKIQAPLSSGNNDSRYAVGRVAFFGEELPLSPVFSPYRNQKIFISPGNYQGEGVLVLRDQYDGEWDYWLTKDLALESGKAYTWILDNNFSPTIALDKKSYQLKDILHSTHNFVDGAGNKLVGMTTDLGLDNYYDLSKIDLARQLPGENTSFTNSLGRFIEAQNYWEIAPFLVIEDPEGKEIYRHKKVAPEFSEEKNEQEHVYPISKESTFYQGQYLIPEDAEGGGYTAHLELGAGPEGLIKTEKTFFTINAVPGAPLWEALVSPTKAETVSIKGSTMPLALVTLKYSLNEGSLVEVGAVEAGEDGKFTFDSVLLPSEGSYSFVAFASLNDLTGEVSLPLVVVVDRTPPAPPNNLGAKGEDQSHILVSWQPSADQDVAYYVLYRNGQELSRISGNHTLTYLDQGLVSGIDYEYTIIAEDQAGNLSSPAKISGRTADEGDKLSPSVPANLQGISLPGGEAKLSWEAATDNVGVTGYQIWRMSGDEEETLIATVSELNFTDRSLNAETGYYYRVLAFDAGENKSEKSSRVQIIVPPLKVSGLTWHIGRNMNGFPLEEGTLTINFTAERNRQSIAEVVYQSWVDDQGQSLPGPRSVTTSTELLEQAGNPILGLSLYRGAFKLPADLAELTSLTGIVLDKGGHQATRQGSGFPLYLTGNLSIKINADGEDLSSLDEGRLVVWSDSVGGGKTVNFSGLGIYPVPGLTPGADYELQVFDGQGNRLFRQENISVIGGMGKELDLNLPLPAALDIRVVDEEKGLAVPEVKVDYYLANGRYLATGTSGLDGWVKNSAGMGPVTPFLLSGTEVKAKASLDQEQRNFYQSATMVEKTLLSGVNQGEIKLKAQSMGKLKGTITDSNGNVLVDARIVVSQWLEGRSVSYSAETDAQGQYELALLAGPAQATFSHRRTSSKSLSISINEGIVTEQDIELPTIATVTLAVFTKGAGDDQKRPLDLDWRVGVHFKIRWVNITTGKSNFNTSVGSHWPDIAIPWGKQGDEIKISVNGLEGGLSSQETIVTLDENGWAKAEIILNEQGRITARVRDEGGVRHGSLPVTMELYHFDPDNPEVWQPLSALRAITLTNGKSQPVPAGRYKGIVYWGPYRSNIVNPTTGETVYFTDGVKISDFTVVDGEITDLGDINLPLSYLGNGVFRGKEGNSFAANVSAAAPGEVVTLRAAYHYSGAGNAHPQNIKLRLAIPKGGELVPESTLVRTISGRAVYEETAQNQIVYNLEEDTQSAQLEGTITYQVRLKTAPDWPTTAAKALISYSMNGYNSTEELDTAVINTPYISLETPGQVTKAAIKLSGRAPNDSKVCVYEGETYLGETTASRFGVWYLDVTLPDRGQPSMHFLRGESGDGEQKIVSKPARVVLNEKMPVATKLVMYQKDGRRVEMDPREGIASFPYVYVPGMITFFEIEFNQPEQIEFADIVTENGGTIHTTWNEGKNVFQAQKSFISWTASPGDIYVSYKVKKHQYQVKPLPNEEELRRSLPEPWRNAIVSMMEGASASFTDQSAVGPNPSPGISIALNGDEHKKLNLTFEVKTLPNIPASDGALVVLNGGPTVHNYKTSIKEISGRVHMEVSCIVSESDLEPYLSGESQSLKGQAGNKIELKLIADSPVDGGLGIADLYDTIKSGFDFKDKMDQLNSLLDQADSSCGGNAGGYYHDMAEHYANTAMTNLCVKYGLQLGGIALGATGVGLIGTVAVSAITNIMTEVGDARWEKNVADLQQQLSNDDECKRDDDDNNDDYDDNDDNDNDRDYPKKKKKVAKPKYIWDPSGYVYEGVSSNRLEGVTTTVLEKDGISGEWGFWDAKEFFQENPLVTDAQGRYAWDVPEGLWQVTYEKEGYQIALSEELTVPPPQLDVNIGMVSLSAPNISAVIPAAGGSYIDISFDKYMRVTTLSDATVRLDEVGQSDEFGNPVGVKGTITPLDQAMAPGLPEVQLTRTIRFTPEIALTVGNSYQLWVSEMVQSYAQRIMTGDDQRTVLIPKKDDPVDPVDPNPPDENNPPSGGGSGGNGSENPLFNNINQLIKKSNGGIIEASDHSIMINIPAAALTQDGLFKITQIVGNAVPALGQLISGSQFYDIILEEAKLQGKVSLTIFFDQNRFFGISADQIGIYYWDEAQNKWIWLGGAVDSAQGKVTQEVSHFTKFAVLADKNIPVFTDIDDHWAAQEIRHLSGLGMIKGYPDNTYQPEKKVTRAEFAKLLVQFMGWMPSDIAPNFKDGRKLPSWAVGYIARGVEKGLITGYQDQSFRGDQEISRGEMAIMAMRALGILDVKVNQTGNLSFADVLDIPTWAAKDIYQAVHAGIIKGRPGNLFRAKELATRGETAVILVRMLNKLEEKKQEEEMTGIRQASGVVVISEVEGRYFKLKLCADSMGAEYVLIPAGDSVKQLLESKVGKEVIVTGHLEEKFNIYMRGPVLKVTEVKDKTTKDKGG